MTTPDYTVMVIGDEVQQMADTLRAGDLENEGGDESAVPPPAVYAAAVQRWLGTVLDNILEDPGHYAYGARPLGCFDEDLAAVERRLLFDGNPLAQRPNQTGEGREISHLQTNLPPDDGADAVYEVSDDRSAGPGIAGPGAPGGVVDGGPQSPVTHDYDAPEPILATAVTNVLAAAGHPLSVYAGQGAGYTPGPFLDWHSPALVHVCAEAGGPWYDLDPAARSANLAAVTAYAAILGAAGLVALVETYPDGRPYVAVSASAEQGVA